MDLGTGLTALIMLAVCVLPFIVMNQKKQKRIKHLKQTFTDFAKETNHTIGEYDICGGIVIGLDSTSSTLYFVKENATTNVKINLEIKNISSVSTDKTHLNETSAFDKIALTFSLKDNASKLTQFVLFDSDDRLQLDGELQLAEKWQKTIQSMI